MARINAAHFSCAFAFPARLRISRIAEMAEIGTLSMFLGQFSISAQFVRMFRAEEIER